MNRTSRNYDNLRSRMKYSRPRASVSLPRKDFGELVSQDVAYNQPIEPFELSLSDQKPKKHHHHPEIQQFKVEPEPNFEQPGIKGKFKKSRTRIRVNLEKTTKTLFINQKPIIAISVVVILLGIGIIFSTFNSKRADNKNVLGINKIGQDNNPDSGSKVPDEQKISEGIARNFQVNPRLPRRVIIDKIKLDAIVSRLGMDGSGQFALPPNINVLGWFENSAQPGKNGTSIFSGINKGAHSEGAFYKLSQVVAGDTIVVERGDHTFYNYKVVSLEQCPNNFKDMNFVGSESVVGEVLLVNCSSYGDNSNKNNGSRRTILKTYCRLDPKSRIILVEKVKICERLSKFLLTIDLFVKQAVHHPIMLKK